MILYEGVATGAIEGIQYYSYFSSGILHMTYVFHFLSASVRRISGRVAASSLYTVHEDAMQLLPPDIAELRQYNASMSGVISL
jgi:hypothetical protein